MESGHPWMKGSSRSIHRLVALDVLLTSLTITAPMSWYWVFASSTIFTMHHFSCDSTNGNATIYSSWASICPMSRSSYSNFLLKVKSIAYFSPSINHLTNISCVPQSSSSTLVPHKMSLPHQKKETKEQHDFALWPSVYVPNLHQGKFYKIGTSTLHSIFYIDSLYEARVLHQVLPKLLRTSVCIKMVVALASTIASINPLLCPMFSSTMFHRMRDLMMDPCRLLDSNLL